MADERYRHLRPTDTATEYNYKPSGRGPRPRLRARNRGEQARLVANELRAAIDEAHAVVEDDAEGIVLTFASEPGFDLALKSLDSSRARGPQLLNVRVREGVTYATVFIPEGQIARLTRLVQGYATEDDPRWGTPKNRTLVESIAAIRRAALRSFWTDDDEAFPDDQERAWWEVWLRRRDDGALVRFAEHAREHNVVVGDSTVNFIDRRVALCCATPEEMSASVEALDLVAELRRAKDVSADILDLPAADQADLVEDLLGRLRLVADADAPAVCTLDTGVNRGHRLLNAALSPDACFAYRPSWRTDDHHGHGTEMAGLALYGDLAAALVSGGQVDLRHQLESAKILPPAGQNPKELWGAVTTDGVAQAEVSAPNRDRVALLAVCATDDRDRGRPSSWSGQIDAFTAGADDGQRRLFVVAAGNARRYPAVNYPQSNETDGVHDPGQSWNALTVGGSTQKVHISDATFAGWQPVAPAGDLAPSSTTSLTWERAWPIKPELVVEAGNWAIDSSRTQVDPVDSLSLVTTHHQPMVRSLTATGDTSAAAAQLAHAAAQLHAAYRDLRPETVRGLLVHSARWTPEMVARVPDVQQRLRTFGWGIPSLDRALYSARDVLTLIVEEDLQPYERRGSRGAMKHLHLHELPWPNQALEDLGNEIAELRVTLSYFVEPSPGRRGWAHRHRYRSHGLRVKLSRPAESRTGFEGRLAAAAADDDDAEPPASSGSGTDRWTLGRVAQTSGSVHSDVWRGPAVELASCNLISIHPVVGWWRERHQLGRVDRRARYSLVVSIRTPETTVDVDLYTPVATQIGVAVKNLVVV